MEKTPHRPLEQLMADINKYRELKNKNFIHKKSGTSYQLILISIDVNTQETLGTYCLNAIPALKFTRPMSEFVEKFEEGHSSK